MGVVNLHRRQHEDPEATGRQLVEIVTLVPLSDMMSRGIIALLIVLTVLAWVTSGLRVYTKHRFLQYTIDDWLMFITIGLYTTMMGTLIIAVYFVLFGLETATLATMSKITNVSIEMEYSVQCINHRRCYLLLKALILGHSYSSSSRWSCSSAQS